MGEVYEAKDRYLQDDAIAFKTISPDDPRSRSTNSHRKRSTTRPPGNPPKRLASLRPYEDERGVCFFLSMKRTPKDSPEYVVSTLKQVLADDQVSIKQIGEVEKVSASPLLVDLLKAINHVDDSKWPGVPAISMMVMGATDGLPTYGAHDSSWIETTGACTLKMNVCALNLFMKARSCCAVWSGCWQNSGCTGRICSPRLQRK
jgi:hypothetical protein